MTSQRLAMTATPRTILGKQVKHLRSQGMIPANVFGSDITSVSVTLPEKEFRAVYAQAGETGLVDLRVEGENTPRPVLVVDVARHPVTAALLHVDLRQVNLNETITANIPVETTGESEAVKNGGVLVVSHNEIEVEALPTDLPEAFTIDLSKLAAIGDTITVKDLSYDASKITLSLEEDEVLASVQEQQAEEVVEVASTEPVEVELTKQGATTEEGKEEQPAA